VILFCNSGMTNLYVIKSFLSIIFAYVCREHMLSYVGLTPDLLDDGSAW